MIYGNTVGGSGGGGFGNTFIIQDADGNEFVGVVTDKRVVFDATPNDIRSGKVAATMDGVVTGEKEIPSYHVTEGYRFVTSGSSFVIPIAKLDRYDFTKLQAIICPYSGSISGSVAADKIAINEGVYPVNSSELIATVTKDAENKQINFGITNESESLYLLRFFTYKEIY